MKTAPPKRKAFKKEVPAPDAKSEEGADHRTFYRIATALI
jgi:hypothetical protein